MTDSNRSLNVSCCSCGSGCCPEQTDTPTAKRHINIDFMYLDLSICNRCQGTDASLEDAFANVAGLLKAAGVDVTINKIHITSEQQAQELRFASSPTIRVNDHDIQMEVKESLCESCGDLCGDAVDCRVWVYQGQEYTIPPKAMIVDAILREVYGGGTTQLVASDEQFVVPDNLKRFFKSMQRIG